MFYGQTLAFNRPLNHPKLATGSFLQNSLELMNTDPHSSIYDFCRTDKPFLIYCRKASNFPAIL